MPDSLNSIHTDPTYATSFSRNLGILTQEEQARLANATVAVIGTGGIGSSCLSILARMGVGRFHLVDPDVFELANINRQFGAKVSTQGRHKVEVLRDEILDINPLASVTVWTERFADGIADAVLDGCGLCIDAIDFYAIDDHLTLHRAARRKGLYVLMGSPVGFSACLQIFDPDGMSIEDYCGITAEMNDVERQLRYACGIVPRLAHISYYDVSKQNSNTDFLNRSGPSLASACTLAAALVAGEVAMILVGRRKPRVIPHTLQYDPCTFRNESVYIDGGMPAYDPSDVIEGIEDKSSLVVNIFDHFYRKVRAATLDLPDGGRLCYRSEGDGRPVVLIPPVGGDTSFWARQAPALAADFRVITLDNRGAGRSSPLPADADVATMAADVIHLLDFLKLEDAVLVGSALGGLIALQCALLRPDRIAGLFVAAAYAEADRTIADVTGRWRDLALTKGMTAVFDDSIDWIFGKTYRASNKDEIYKLKTFYRVNEQHPDEFCKQTLIGNAFRPTAPLDRISCPVGIIHGGEDLLVAPDHARTLERMIPNSRAAVLPDAGHFLNWEAAGRFNDGLRGFLADLPRKG